MKPLPTVVLQLLAQLPDETRKVILNTDGVGRWDIEVFSRYSVHEPSLATEAWETLVPSAERRARPRG